MKKIYLLFSVYTLNRKKLKTVNDNRDRLTDSRQRAAPNDLL